MEYYFQPRALFNTAVNDNRRLRLDPGPTVYRGLTDVRVRAHAISETFYGLIAPRARISRFEGDSLLNSDEYFFETFADQMFQQGRLRVDGSYSDTATINSELEDSGRFGTNGQKRSYIISPAYTYYHSPQLLFSVSTSANKVDFDGENRGFVNYEYLAGSMGLTYQQSDRTTWTATFGKTIFITEANTRTESVSFMVGLQHALADSVDVAYSIGPIRSDIEFVSTVFGQRPSGAISIANVKESVHAGGVRIDINVEKRHERGRFAASFNRDLVPSSVGEQTATNLVRGETTWRFNDYWDTAGVFVFREQKSEAELRPASNRTTYFVEALIRRRLSRTWKVALKYHHRRFIRALGTAADANELSVSFIYDGGTPSVIHRR